MIAVKSQGSSGTRQQVREATIEDQQKIADLIFFESHVHRHLDWRTPLDWLGSAPFYVFEEGRQITAALACPPDPDSIAWIRLFAYASHLSGSTAWPPLWSASRDQLAARGGGTAASIATQHWFGQILDEAGFDLAGHIVLLERSDDMQVGRQLPAKLAIRPMTVDDLPKVAALDAAAFEPLWQNSLVALNKALAQSSYASVAEDGSGLVGYQLSTGGAFGAHLARLAVRPDVQGQGVGAALVRDLIDHMKRAGGSRVTVNTQANNAASLALYARLGFRRTGEKYPVYTYQVK